jgi:ribosomal 30S subunit maturation factor RimM
MDYDDYMDCGNDDYFHDNDGNDDDDSDDEFYYLDFVGCHAVVTYVIPR